MEQKRQFQEYLANVNYHLKFAEDAYRQCSLIVTGFQHQMIGKEEVMLFLEPEAIIRLGDIAIREAVSAIDTSLALINFVLSFPIEKGKMIIWRNREEKTGLGYKIESNGKFNNLVKEIDETYDSIGYKLLNQYRNWITHRGAPAVIVDPKLNQPVTLPVDIVNSNNPDFAARSFLDSLIYSMISIRCKRFALPASTIYGANIKELDKDIQLPGGVSISKSASDIRIGRAVVQGSVFENADKYLAEKGAFLEKGTVEYAGERLAIYQLPDYLQSVYTVVSRFAETCLKENWDRELYAICQQG